MSTRKSTAKRPRVDFPPRPVLHEPSRQAPAAAPVIPCPQPPAPQQQVDEAHAYHREIEEEEARWPGEIWRAYDDESGKEVGFLISERGDVDMVLAFVPQRARGKFSDSDDAYALARELCEHPYAVAGVHSSAAWDLRRFARLDSDEPTPEFLYRLDVASDEENRRFARRLWPFCRLRLARLVEQHNTMTWPRASRDRAAHLILNTIGICNAAGDELEVANVGVSSLDVEIRTSKVE